MQFERHSTGRRNPPRDEPDPERYEERREDRSVATDWAGARSDLEHALSLSLADAQNLYSCASRCPRIHDGVWRSQRALAQFRSPAPPEPMGSSLPVPLHLRNLTWNRI